MSVLGSLLGIAFLVFLAPKLARIAIGFSSYDYCALTIFSLTLVVSLTGKDMVKGFISAILGAMFAAVGSAPLDSIARFTFGMYELRSGLKTLSFLVGLFAIKEIVAFAMDSRNEDRLSVNTNDYKINGFGLSLKEFVQQLPNFFRSSLIGIGIGILPGIGASTSGLVAYSVAKNSSKYPEKFGTGIVDGIVASESCNNATVSGTMISMLALGIPGDATTAILMGALMVHNIAPGPLVFNTNKEFVYGIFFAMLLSTILMLFIAYWGIKYFVKLMNIPKNYLMPAIIVCCVIGAIGESNLVFDAWTLFLFGLVGFALMKLGIPSTPMILGFILSNQFESNLRKVSQRMMYDPNEILHQPLAWILILLAIVSVVISLRNNRRAKAKENVEASA